MAKGLKIKIKRSDDKQHYFVIVARNGRVVATSETYRTWQGCLKSARLFNMQIIYPDAAEIRFN